MIGFCFSGEGARGAIQSGIALSLYRKGIQADLTTGTSSGSACAAAYAYLGPEGMADMWRKVKNIGSLFGINWDFLWNTGFLHQKPMEKIMFNMIKNKPICESIVLRLNIETGELQYVNNKEVGPEEFAEAALGAVAVTAMVKDRNGWVDAGSREMSPLQTCIDAGCDEIYVILGRPLEIPQWQKPRGLLKLAQMGYRALDISLCELLMRDIRKCLRKNGEPGYRGIQIHLMEPNELLYDSILFRKCKVGVEYGLTHFTEMRETGLLEHRIEMQLQTRLDR